MFFGRSFQHNTSNKKCGGKKVTEDERYDSVLKRKKNVLETKGGKTKPLLIKKSHHTTSLPGYRTKYTSKTKKGGKQKKEGQRKERMF
mmetsp:Transcript_58785/g.68709  ORF Transcript_58785/g.68709 Transcript_58785/m.68709 type:complete len:88 (+) Transcript_58785:315-578(+)